jgi:hypothetical protein
MPDCGDDGTKAPNFSLGSSVADTGFEKDDRAIKHPVRRATFGTNLAPRPIAPSRLDLGSLASGAGRRVAGCDPADASCSLVPSRYRRTSERP